MDITHRKFLTQTHGVDVRGGGMYIYVVSFPRVLALVVFLVEGFLERMHNPGRIHEHCMYRHWKA